MNKVCNSFADTRVESFDMVRFILGIVLVAAMASESMAQGSQYTTAQINQFKTRNSASGFTSQRMSSSVFNRTVPRYNFSSVNQGVLRSATGSSMGGSPTGTQQKPFANANMGSSTSPYMGLLADTPFTSTTTNYFNKVRPQIEQQRMNEKLMSQNMRLQQQLQAVAAKGPYDPTGAENRAPTGHAAAYMNNGGVYGNHGGYYPQVPIKGVRNGR